MKKKTPSNSFLGTLIGNILKKISKFFRTIDKFGRKNKKTLEKIQLSFIYFFGLLTLMITVRLALGYFPEVFTRFIPFSRQILSSPLAYYFASPSKTFAIYMVIHELILLRGVFNLSVLVRFNILYIAILEMIANVSIAWWDLFFNTELDLYTYKYVDVVVARHFFTILFGMFFVTYLYSYIQAMRSKLPKFPHPTLQKIPDSVAFWLQLERKVEERK